MVPSNMNRILLTNIQCIYSPINHSIVFPSIENKQAANGFIYNKFLSLHGMNPRSNRATIPDYNTSNDGKPTSKYTQQKMEKANNFLRN